MEEAEFERIAGREWDAMPEKFRAHVENVALLVEDEPGEDLRKLEGLAEGETLLGHYHGIPNTLRGAEYGVGATLPDTITLYRLPLLEEAQELMEENGGTYEENITRAIRETLWHEVGHYFGFDEERVREREDEGTNRFNDRADSLPTTAVKGIIERDGHILLLQRPQGDWDLPGGLLEPGESDETGLVREIFEETGLQAEVVRFSGAWFFLRPKDSARVSVKNYLCAFTDRESAVRLSTEHTAYAWVVPSEITDYALKDASLAHSVAAEYRK